MKDPMRRRIRLFGCVNRSTSGDFTFGVDSLVKQLRNAHFGGLPVDQEKAPDSFYDEDDVFDVDPSSDPSLDRFERTEKIASSISKRMSAKKKEQLEKAEA